jgi:hypothetical protein
VTSAAEIPDLEAAFPQDIYSNAAVAGFKWLNALRHADAAGPFAQDLQTPDPWWSTRTQDFTDTSGTTIIDFPRTGYPDWNYLQDGSVPPVSVNPPWSETLSLLTLRNRTPPGFAGFAGLEVNQLGHVLALYGEQAPVNECIGCDAAGFLIWLKTNGGVAIVAHPSGNPTETNVPVLDTSTSRNSGLSDSFIQGLAIGNCAQACQPPAFLNDLGLYTWTWRGFRMFPNVTSDIHIYRPDKYNASCSAGTALGGISGATVCWVSDTFAQPQPEERRLAVLEPCERAAATRRSPTFRSSSSSSAPTGAARPASDRGWRWVRLHLSSRRPRCRCWPRRQGTPIPVTRIRPCRGSSSWA